MTRLLEQLFAQASKLPPEQQDSLAQRWSEELQDDKKWDAAFESSQNELSKLATDVREKIRSGKTDSTEIDAL